MAAEEGKRVSWVELYLDLVVVLAVAQLSNLIVRAPEADSVWIALGLFVAIWWTWIGFAVLYNRHGADGTTLRLLFLAGSVPLGIAAVGIAPVATGDPAAFAASMAAVRLVLAVAHRGGGARRDGLRIRTTHAYLVSAAVFAISIAVASPWCYVLWGLTVAGESGVLLTDDRSARRRLREDRDLSRLAPADPEEALDAHHFAERFGLFLIILLGEVVVEAGQASADGGISGAGPWAALGSAMILAAALWWLYFDGAADLNLRVLSLSGGSPTVARTLFAVGHQVPAFGLLLAAAGIGLLLDHAPPAAAYWLLCIGVGMYLAGTRVVVLATRRWGHLGRLVVLATFLLGTLHDVLGPHTYLWIVTAWVVAVVATASWRTHHLRADDLVRLGGEPRS